MLDFLADFSHQVHMKEYGTFPRVSASAPGKLNLLGDYTEFAKGLFLSLALSCRLYITVSLRSDGLVRLYSREYNERKKTSISNLKFRREDRWANYPKGVLAHFAQLGVSVEGVDIAICSDIHQGVGLGSSQALCLASALAFNEIFHAGWTLAQLIQLAYRVESGFVGVNTGVSSFFVQAYACENHLGLLDCRSFEWRLFSFPWPDLELVMINSRVPPTSFDTLSMDAQENCDICLKILTGGKNNRSLRDFTKDNLREQVGLMPEPARRCSFHIIEEISRTQEALVYLQAKDSASLGSLMNRSHDGLRELYEISCPEIDWLVRRLQENDGVLGARMSGETSGGCVIALVRTGVWKNFLTQIQEYERIFGFKADFYAFRPSSGSCLHCVDGQLLNT